ncbi:MAG: hypothetical protein Q8859_10380 [Bacteroidota bacterium]|nr:hypothetical protein [Bacteroidota bacterium]
MKRTSLFGIFLVFLSVISLVNCSDDDKIDINQLKGTWLIAFDDPNIVMEGGVEYTFNNDNTCSICNYNALSTKDSTFYRKYIVSIDKQVLTIYKDNMYRKESDPFTGQYNIKKLTSKEMRLESVDERNNNKKLVRINK